MIQFINSFAYWAFGFGSIVFILLLILKFFIKIPLSFFKK